jgi:hypothetical protein
MSIDHEKVGVGLDLGQAIRAGVSGRRGQSMIPKSGCRFSEKIMLHQKVRADDDSNKSHLALRRRKGLRGAASPMVAPRKTFYRGT